MGKTRIPHKRFEAGLSTNHKSDATHVSEHPSMITNTIVPESGALSTRLLRCSETRAGALVLAKNLFEQWRDLCGRIGADLLLLLAKHVEKTV
jgi:hypothetical protein